MDGLPSWFREILLQHAPFVFSDGYMATGTDKRFIDVLEIFSGKKNLSLACEAVAWQIYMHNVLCLCIYSYILYSVGHVNNASEILDGLCCLHLRLCGQSP